MDTTWKLSGRTIIGDVPVEITARNEDVLTFTPEEGVFEPMPSRLLGFVKLNPDDGDQHGKTSMITLGRQLDVSYEEATEGGGDVRTGELFPYFLGAGNYDVLLAVTIDAFVQVP